MSLINVNTIEPSTGTTVTLGASGDTFNIPSGVTLTNNGTMNASAITAGTLPIARGGTGSTSTTFVNAATNITGNLPVANLNGGSSASSSTFWRGDGSWAAAAGGKILQVKQLAGAYVTTVATTTYTHNLSAPTITPSATSSKILVLYSAPSGITLSNTTNMGHATIFRDAVNITTFGHGSSYASYQGGSPLSGTGIIILDSPSSTSALQYSIYVKTDNAALSMVYGYSAGQPRGSSITVMEIGV